ncbi:N-acetyltransferase [Saccharophagus sp. K07]|jgi:ribosomal-protein-serine acetyltransferase|uniref:GNAT family N-acetyltransferase n=1 Tax=Saccharophagus sp. K07 TaxID=2283636 RepID=UPI001651EF10|nr:GNAT family protein [Saccharophagus sp. K07]MBC6906389.1 N-acetyltransferase [Saccharophagus sp. K07]
MRISTDMGWLDPLRVEHAEPLFELIHNSRSHLYPWLPWLKRIHSPQDTEAFIRQLCTERGPQFVIMVDDRVCGGVGFYHLEKAERKATVGYWLGAEYVGQGIMTDAVRHLCHYGFEHLDLKRVEIRCASQNMSSRKVPERLGFFYEGVQPKAEWLTDRYVDHAIYSILKEEFSLAFAQDSEPAPISPREERALVPGERPAEAPGASKSDKDHWPEWPRLNW